MFYHILFNCPRLGLYKESTNESLVMHDLRNAVVKQLSEMTLEMFKKYCEVREYKEDVTDKNGAIPLYKQEFHGDVKEDT